MSPTDGVRSREIADDRIVAGEATIAQRGRRRWHFGHAVLDELTHELLVDSIDAEIERKPLEVLVYLLQHAGEVCTKDELLAAVWPGRCLSDTVLTKCIGRLREVLKDEDQSIIRTAYGFGYRFVAAVRVESLPARERFGFDFKVDDRVPMRPHWRLLEHLGTGGSGDTWLVRHEKTGEQRVFKFARDEKSLIALKREITLFRVINDRLGDRAGVVRLMDWNLEHHPYFIEEQHVRGGCLVDWARSRGGLAALPLKDRLEIVSKISLSIAAVHSVGVLHKDLKPSNILMEPRPDGGVDVVLADFGSGGILDLDELFKLGITCHGFTQTIAGGNGGDSGTPMYLAPEILAGQPLTVKADIYAIGVILYQFVVADFNKWLTPGWSAGLRTSC